MAYLCNGVTNLSHAYLPQRHPLDRWHLGLDHSFLGLPGSCSGPLPDGEGCESERLLGASFASRNGSFRTGVLTSCKTASGDKHPMEKTIRAPGFRRIKVVSIGGGGHSAVSYMVDS